jgi:regulator of sigma D
MNKNITAARRKEIEDIINRWKLQRDAIHDDLEESLYSDHALQVEEQDFPIELFCESLMDYISAGHFEVYETLLHDSTAELAANRALLEEIYHSIETTTDLALTFNDKYKGELVHSSEDVSLPQDLLDLDGALTIRFALEDQLLELTSQ